MPSVQCIQTKLDDAALCLKTPNGGVLRQDLNEKWLLHGTKPELVNLVLENKLNERFGRGLFGSGVYLAEDAEKMDQYCTPDRRSATGLDDLHGILYGAGPDRVKRPHDGRDGDIFYAFVVLACCGIPVRTKDGEYDLNKPGYKIFSSDDKRELAFVPGTNVRFHSLLAETGGIIKRYREFVIFNGDRTNIAYLIAYLRK